MAPRPVNHRNNVGVEGRRTRPNGLKILIGQSSYSKE
jgi:hypothetical protein